MVNSKVTRIGNGAFSGCSSIPRILIPDSVIIIGADSFKGATSLEVVVIGSGVTDIEAGAFSGCESITVLVIPDNVEKIGQGTFENCTSLTDITIGKGVIFVDITAFEGSINIVTIYTDNYNQTIYNAFSYSPNVTFIEIPDVGPVVCFKQGSKILTDKGYKLIQDLRKGDLIKTLKDEYKPIFMIGKRSMHHPASNERIKDQLYKCCQEKYPEIFEPLVITGCHSILVDGFISHDQRAKTIEVNGDTYVTDDKYRLPACVDERASVYEIEGNYTIYHLALENENYYYNYGVYANGLLVETCSKRYLKELSNMIVVE
jgi:hypothetical protein